MKIAIRGVIGTGKSYVSRIINQEFGYQVFDADKYVHELYENDIELQQELDAEFSTHKRAEISKIVFDDQIKLKKLENLIIPKVAKQMQLINDANIVWDCPTIDLISNVEIDVNIVCVADIGTIISRVTARDNRDESQIRQIVKIQDKPLKLHNRTYYVDTTATDEEIKKVLSKIIRSVDASKNWKDC